MQGWVDLAGWSSLPILQNSQISTSNFSKLSYYHNHMQSTVPALPMPHVCIFWITAKNTHRSSTTMPNIHNSKLQPRPAPFLSKQFWIPEGQRNLFETGRLPCRMYLSLILVTSLAGSSLPMLRPRTAAAAADVWYMKGSVSSGETGGDGYRAG